MQQVARPTKQYSTTIPEALVVARNPHAFVPPSILLPAIVGTGKHYTFIFLTRIIGNNMSCACIASIIIQYADDATPQLIKRCLAPKIEAASFFDGRCATYWKNSGMPALILDNGTRLSQHIYIPADFSLIFEMLDDLENWMLLSLESGSTEPEVEETVLNCAKLKRVVLAGQAKMWEMHPTYINIEGIKKYNMLFSNFWIWYDRFIENMQV